MDRWASGNELNLIGPVKSIRVEEQIFEFETHFIYEQKKPLLKERFEFDREGRKFEEYTYTIDGRESPKTVSIYNDKSWLIRQDTYSGLTQKPYLVTRYQYDKNGNVIDASQYSLDDNQLLQKWVFTHDPAKAYFEFTDTDSRSKWRGRVGFTNDDRCRIIEISAFQHDRKLAAKTTLTLDDRNNPVTATNRLPSDEIVGKRKFEYELDARENWIKKSDFEWRDVNGKGEWKLMNVVFRKIEYYDSK